MSESSFNNQTPDISFGKRLDVAGSTCDCYCLRLHGKLHFMKRLKEPLRSHPKYVAALQKEFEVGYNLDHPNLVKYLAQGKDSILMEYVDGMPLDEFFAENRNVNYATERRLLQELLDVVDYLHSRQVVHLDLKPDNILVTRIGHTIKLVDLGYCYSDAFTDTTGRTDRYAAPEQFEPGGWVDARTDIYALGRLLECFPSAKRYKPVIARATATKAADRYPTVAALREGLKKRALSNSKIAITIATVIALVATAWLALRPAHQPTTSTPALINEEVSKDTTENTVKNAATELPKSVETPAAPAPVIIYQDTADIREILNNLAKPAAKKYLDPYRNKPHKEVGVLELAEVERLFDLQFYGDCEAWWERNKDKCGFDGTAFIQSCNRTYERYVVGLYIDMLSHDEEE